MVSPSSGASRGCSRRPWPGRSQSSRSAAAPFSRRSTASGSCARVHGAPRRRRRRRGTACAARIVRWLGGRTTFEALLSPAGGLRGSGRCRSRGRRRRASCSARDPPRWKVSSSIRSRSSWTSASRSFTAAGRRQPPPAPVGEEAKALAVVERLWSELTLGRDGTIVAFGGGSTTDVAGFVAATYLRGLPWIAVPTTLTGQVDASIGGKTGINTADGKNLAAPSTSRRRSSSARIPRHASRAGAPGRLGRGGEDRAPRRQRRVGAGRRRHDPRLCRLQGRHRPLRPLRDRGRRAWLNLGHTFAHALEAGSGYRVSHGEQLRSGCSPRCASRASRRMSSRRSAAGAGRRRPRDRLGCAEARQERRGRVRPAGGPGKPVVAAVPRPKPAPRWPRSCGSRLAACGGRPQRRQPRRPRRPRPRYVRWAEPRRARDPYLRLGPRLRLHGPLLPDKSRRAVRGVVPRHSSVGVRPDRQPGCLVALQLRHPRRPRALLGAGRRGAPVGHREP